MDQVGGPKARWEERMGLEVETETGLGRGLRAWVTGGAVTGWLGLFLVEADGLDSGRGPGCEERPKVKGGGAGGEDEDGNGWGNGRTGLGMKERWRG